MELPPISRRVKENMPQKLFTFMIVIDLRVNYGLNVFFSKIYDIQYLKKKKKGYSLKVLQISQNIKEKSVIEVPKSFLFSSSPCYAV